MAKGVISQQWRENYSKIILIKDILKNVTSVISPKERIDIAKEKMYKVKSQ